VQCLRLKLVLQDYLDELHAVAGIPTPFLPFGILIDALYVMHPADLQERLRLSTVTKLSCDRKDGVSRAPHVNARRRHEGIFTHASAAG
jgi:hypothetical protein